MIPKVREVKSNFNMYIASPHLVHSAAGAYMAVIGTSSVLMSLLLAIPLTVAVVVYFKVIAKKLTTSKISVRALHLHGQANPTGLVAK